MKYLLVVLTHGDSAPLAECLGSFRRWVRPLPDSAYIHADGERSLAEAHETARLCGGWPWEVGYHDPPAGFCGACRDAWKESASCASDFVFWLEHDFVFTRPVDLAELAAVLDANPQLAQMALMRDAVNEQEKAAGGLYESRPGQYALRQAFRPFTGPSPAGPVGPWLEHRAYLTTNPSLMRRQFMADNPWPAYDSECEGKFGIDLLARGYTFGVWGDGEPWVRHVGTRSGFGY